MTKSFIFDLWSFRHYVLQYCITKLTVATNDGFVFLSNTAKELLFDDCPATSVDHERNKRVTVSERHAYFQGQSWDCDFNLRIP